MGLSRYNNNNSNYDSSTINSNASFNLYNTSLDNDKNNNNSNNNKNNSGKKSKSKKSKHRLDKYLNEIEDPENTVNRKKFILQSDTNTTKKRRDRRHQREDKRRDRRRERRKSGNTNVLTIVMLAVVSFIMILIAGGDSRMSVFKERVVETMKAHEFDSAATHNDNRRMVRDDSINEYRKRNSNRDDDEVFTNLRTQMLDKLPEKDDSSSARLKKNEELRQKKEEDEQQKLVSSNNKKTTNNATVTVWDNLADTMSEGVDDAADFVPFFFHVPRNGGRVIRDIAGNCLNKIQANEMGVRSTNIDATRTDQKLLQVVTIDNLPYVNVDVSTVTGIERASHIMNFPNSNILLNNNNTGTSSINKNDVLVSSSYFVHAVKYLFTPEKPGRAFLLLRNPIARAISTYQYQKSKGLISENTLEEYANGAGMENNWMTRYLTNTLTGKLSDTHLQQAKKILSKKFLIGFLDNGNLRESVRRMIQYYEWDDDENEGNANNIDNEENNLHYEGIQKALSLQAKEDCMGERLKELEQRLAYTDNDSENKVERKKDGKKIPSNYDHTLPEKGSRAHGLLSWQTQYDMKLYEFAKQLFEIQTDRYGSRLKKKNKKRKKFG